MFNLEIKKISLKSIVLSAYPFIVFLFSLASSFLSMGDLLEAESGLFTQITQILIFSLMTTAVIVIFSILAGFVYNLLCSFGMKGIRFSVVDLDEENKEEEDQPQEEEKK